MPDYIRHPKSKYFPHVTNSQTANNPDLIIQRQRSQVCESD